LNVKISCRISKSRQNKKNNHTGFKNIQTGWDIQNMGKYLDKGEWMMIDR